MSRLIQKTLLEDVWFLIRTKEEMKRQENDGTAQPVYWEVHQTVQKNAASGYGDDFIIVFYEDGHEVKTKQELINYLSDDDLDDPDNSEEVTLRKALEDAPEDLYECHEILEQYIDVTMIELHEVEDVDEKVNGTVFFLKEDAIKYIEHNKHHLNDTAHTWAAYGGDSPFIVNLYSTLVSENQIANGKHANELEFYCSLVPKTKRFPVTAPEQIDDIHYLLKHEKKVLLKAMINDPTLFVKMETKEIVEQYNVRYKTAEAFKEIAEAIDALEKQNPRCIKKVR